MDLTENARKVLEARYLKKDETGKVCESAEELFRRVAHAVSSAESKYVGTEKLPIDFIQDYEDKFYNMMTNLEFLPNSPTLFNAGKESGTLSGCFFFDVADSMTSIMDVATKSSLVQKHGGGCGFSLSKIRPKGAFIRSTQGHACGPIAVMKVYHSIDEMITQGGKRAGAQMAVLSCNHPNIEEFITCKRDNDTLNTFNISVAVTDEFMQAVENNEDFPLINPQNNEIVREINAKVLFDKIVENAWKNGDPGLLFIDEVNRHNPTPQLGKFTGTNPCVIGETLISTNLGEFPIKELVGNPNIWVLTKLLPSNMCAFVKAIGIRKTGTDIEVYKLVAANKQGVKYEVIATADHAFMLPDNSFIALSDLKINDEIVAYPGDLWSGKTSAVRIIEKVPSGRADVYNLEVPVYHNFVANKLFNHNCVSGDTSVAVADGRVSVPIKQLAEEGRYVPVYCSAEDGTINVRTGRNPRKTGENKAIYKVVLDNNSFIRVTDMHKFLMRDSKTKTTLELISGDSLVPFYKYGYRYHGVEGYWGVNLNNGIYTQEHRIFAEAKLGRELLPFPKEIVHHKDFNPGNNNWSNLIVMTGSQHEIYHQSGDRNIMRNKWWNGLSDKEKNEYIEKQRVSHLGEKNYMFGRKHKEETKIKIGLKTLERFNDPVFREKHRQGVLDAAYKFAPKLRGERVARITKICEYCGSTFEVLPCDSGQRFCSFKCARISLNHDKIGTFHTVETRDKIKAQLAWQKENNPMYIDNKKKAAYISAKSKAIAVGKILLDNSFELTVDKWDNYKDIARQKFGIKYFVSASKIVELFGNWSDFIAFVQQRNHRVKEVIFDGYDDVYNITVDEFHTIAYVTSDKIADDGQRELSGIVTFQCGEQPLLDMESCNLGSINLSKFVNYLAGQFAQDIHNKMISDARLSRIGLERNKDYPMYLDRIDWEHLEEVVKLAVRFLDDVIDINKFPVKEIEEATLRTRKIGLGVMGWADMLVKLEIPYNSDEAVKLAEQVMKFINDIAKDYSQELAYERGHYPAQIEKEVMPESPDDELLIRNASRTTLAPSGSISLIAGCSGGIEPIYALVIKRSHMSGALEGVELNEVYPLFKEKFQYFHLAGHDFDEILARMRDGFSLQEIDFIPDDMRKVFVTAHDISYDWHIKMQAAFQKHVNNAVSKTINMPNSVALEDVRNAYLMAWKNKCKGVTIYRDGSRSEQVLTTESEVKKGTSGVRKRTKTTDGETTLVNCGCGHIYVTVNWDKFGPLELFTHIGSIGECACAQLEAICRLISVSLRSGTSVNSLIKQLKGIKCAKVIWEEGRAILSCADAIASVLEKYSDGSNIKTDISTQCPDCNSSLVFEEGCQKCPVCGYTKC